ncbi:L-lactate MFS transporter [Priestia megaterium]|uniref:L-lactate MFS transporter n=2 Tax=Priestia megaterium TaxID=1404 RepID=UPI000BEE5105|nr:OFA family MFS transporter [Priestia megaterium]MDH6651472.1 OFA family oxalate/formate antiporter-like MFS transporter [Bacillus sp. PvP124]MDP9579396.1 OFA family oxalate/formate antiporter-like MFS transporter [Bacillus sp. 1751]MDH2363586.1 OFA family MFS transporter [Priestia megaterium]MDH2449222.1 OFA family MFS transporter [Priestia megaterium]MDL5148680.1 OFA family MFS transporter [Priestia megaterium]
MKGKDIHPGFLILGTIIVQMGLGTIYTWSLFNQPLVNKFNWELSSVAITFSITSFALAFATLFAGKLQEKWGIRKLIALSGFILGLGLILTSQVSTLLMLYLLAGVIVGFADGTAYITSLSNLIKWFPNRKGLISGVSVSAYGLGSLVFKYINATLIDTVGISQTFFYWGIIVMIMVVGGSLLLREAIVVETPINAENAENKRDYTVKEMLATKEVYFLFIMFFTACMSGLYLISIVKDIGVQLAGLNVAAAANAVAMIAIFNTGGRLILGSLSDKVSRLKVIASTFFITAIAVLTLSFVQLNYGVFFICVAAIAFCFGGNITVFPAIVGDFFGLKNHSKNYGIVYQGFGLGALAGSFIAAFLGGFKPTFIVIGTLCVLSLIIAIFIKPPNHSKRENELEDISKAKLV